MLSRRALVGGGLTMSLSPLSAIAGGLIVESTDGQYQSVSDERQRTDHVWAFHGIRYGSASRLEPPKQLAPATTGLYAQNFGPASPQLGSHFSRQSEDCLFLNIWTLAPFLGKRKPVLVYFHGGAYSTGSVTDPLNDGATLAQRGDVVVVTVNHRLNAFGYLSLARLSPEQAAARRALFA